MLTNNDALSSFIALVTFRGNITSISSPAAQTRAIHGYRYIFTAAGIDLGSSLAPDGTLRVMQPGFSTARGDIYMRMVLPSSQLHHYAVVSRTQSCNQWCSVLPAFYWQ